MIFFLNGLSRFPKKFIVALSLAALTLGGCGGGGDDSGSSATPSTNSCGVIGLSSRIINGTECVKSATPVVRLSISTLNGPQGLCSGALITPNHVLTAAHCFFATPTQVLVDFGSGTVFASQVESHPDVAISPSNQAVNNDVAIVTLSQPVNIPPLSLFLSSVINKGEVFSIFGYGLDQNGDLGVLRSGQMVVNSVSSNHIAAKFQGQGSNTCNGDSGGPAILERLNSSGTVDRGIVGVVSSGTLTSCSVGDLSLFSNVQSNSMASFIISRAPSVDIN